MEFIQCPHCQKQYAVNDKLRAAAGKKIRCKHCKQAFEIKVQKPSKSLPSEPEISPIKEAEPEQAITPADHQDKQDISESTSPAQQTEKSEQPEKSKQSADTKKTAKKPKTLKKKLNIQLIITITLVVVLLVTAIGAFLFFNKLDLFGNSAEKEVQSIIPKDIIQPFEIKLPTQKTKPVVKKITKPTPQTVPKKPATMGPKQATKITLENSPKAVEDNQPSQVCKDTSADYWVRSHTMATANLNTATYMKLLDENLEQADEIRKLCKDKSLIGKIANAARAADIPQWIKQEVNARIIANTLNKQSE